VSTPSCRLNFILVPIAPVYPLLNMKIKSSFIDIFRNDPAFKQAGHDEKLL
jgi:hypothetical protein